MVRLDRRVSLGKLDDGAGVGRLNNSGIIEGIGRGAPALLIKSTPHWVALTPVRRFSGGHGLWVECSVDSG